MHLAVLVELPPRCDELVYIYIHMVHMIGLWDLFLEHHGMEIKQTVLDWICLYQQRVI